MMIKKTALATAISLALVSASTFAATSTVEGQFILDKTAVSVGDSVNLALMGLNKDGAVDQLGEQNGSTLLVTVQTDKGTISSSENTSPDLAVSNAGSGKFQADTKYVKLVQGLGRVAISYKDANAVGSDTITVTLQERAPDGKGGYAYTNIKTIKKTVTVAPAVINATRLAVVGFKPAAADARGIPAGNIDAAKSCADKVVVSAQTTAGVGGGQVAVFACLADGSIDSNANGQLTLALTSKTAQDKVSPVGTEAAAAYTVTAPLSKGKAIVTLPSTITKAASYYLNAKLDTLPNVSSVLGAVGASDVLKVVDTGRVKKLGLTADKTIISNVIETTGATPAAGANAATTVTLSLLDDYSNVTTGILETTPPNYTVTLADANSIVSSTGISLAYPAPTTAILGNAKGQLLKLGDTSLVASVKGNTAIAPSEPLKVKVVSQSLIAQAYAARTEPFIAGNEYPIFSVSVDGILSPSVPADGLYAGTPDNPDTTKDTAVSANSSVTMNIKNIDSGESVSVNLGQGQSKLLALFKTATAGTKYLISDAAGAYGQTIIDVPNFMVKSAAASVAQLQNAHNLQVSTVSPALSPDSKQYVANIPAANVKIFDAYGNAVSSNSAVTALKVDAGSFSVTSANGVVTGANLSPFGAGAITVSYNAIDVGTSKAFVGEDPLTLNFTKPGIGSVSVKSVVPAQPVLKKIVANVEQTSIPVNGEVAVTIETFDQNNKPVGNSSYGLQNITLSFSGALKPTVVDNETGTSLTEGSALASSPSSRKVLVVKAGSVTGDFTLTFNNPDKTVSTPVTFKVTSNLVAQCSSSSVSACTTKDDCSKAGGDFTAATASTPAVCKSVPVSSTGTNVTGLDKDGKAVTVAAAFAQGIAVNGGDFSSVGTVNSFATTPVKLALKITPDAAHVGKKADVVVVASYTDAKSGVTTPVLYTMNGSKPVSWDAKISSLPALTTVTALTAPTDVTIYDGKFLAAGNLSVFVGYRLEDGTLVYGNKTVDITINK